MNALGQWIDDAVAALDPGVPIALFPVRLETRFDRAVPALKVRIYPDEILAHAHEPALTAAEQRAGDRFWSRRGEDERSAWAELVADFGAPRAAWIAESTEPGKPRAESRKHSWTRPVESRLLPDRWLVRAYREAHVVRQAASGPVREPLALTLGPDESSTTLGTGPHAPRVNEGMVWTVDYDRAVEAGMAVTIPIDGTDLARGFDRILVFGVKAMEPEEAGAALAELFQGHRHTRGMAFVRQGTPTNHTAAAPSGYPPADPGATASFAVERSGVQPEDGGRWAAALGLDKAIVRHVAGADLKEQDAARAMATALWPGTLGFFLEQFMHPAFTRDAISKARDWFVDWVRGRGPFPAVRIGGTPYGLLPVRSLQDWVVEAGQSGAAAELRRALLGLWPLWMAASAQVPRAGRTGDPDADLLAALGLEASTREVFLRGAIGPDLVWNGLAFSGVRPGNWLDRLRARAELALKAIRHPDWTPRAAFTLYADRADRVTLPLVGPAPLSEEPPAPAYVAAIARASVDELWSGELPGIGPASTLLDHLLRYSALQAYVASALDLAIQDCLLTEADRREPELVGLTKSARRRGTTRSLFDLTLYQKLPLRDALSPKGGAQQSKILIELRQALEDLAGLSPAELERLLTEVLDVCSHRLDAWVTSLATERLDAMRRERSTGVHLGAYGWVEDLRPADGSAPGGGFIHAPSLDHAATAAVLRNAFLSHAGKRELAIDLSSRRVRAALGLLAALREGQPLGAVLGQRIERALHDHVPPLDRYIAPLRNAYPLVAGKSGSAASGAAEAEALAARNVVDGLALWTDWRALDNPGAQAAFAKRVGIPGPDTEEGRAVEAALAGIEEVLDSVADVLTAESIHQAIRGNTSAASAGLDALARGSRPPDPEVVRIRRATTTLSYRMGIVLSGPDRKQTRWERLQETPRSFAEPLLDAFAGRVLGDPWQIRCAVSYRTSEKGERKLLEVSLADLSPPVEGEPDAETLSKSTGLRAIDVLALSRSAPAAVVPDELARRIEGVVREHEPSAEDLQIHADTDDAWPESGTRTLAQALEVARALAAALGGARVLRKDDLKEPNAVPGAVQDTWPEEIGKRLQTIQGAMEYLAGEQRKAQLAPEKDWDPAGLLDLLRRAATAGIPGAYPSRGPKGELPSRDELVARAAAAERELRRRVGAATATGEDAGAAARALFGEDFLLLAPIMPGNSDELQRGRSVEIGPSPAAAALAVRTWFQRVARVRPALGRWRTLSLYGRALDTPTDDFAVIQLPARKSARWAALPFRDEEDRPAELTASLVLHEPFGAPPPGEAWAGLLLDAWAEAIPRPTETTGLVFHYDDPGSEAAQTILLAVPPDPGVGWSVDALAATIGETLDLAKIRAVTGEHLTDVGQFLPALMLADNAKGDTVVADLRSALERVPAEPDSAPP